MHLDIDITQDRPTFSLDSEGPVVSAVRVDGVAATFEAAAPELIITPAAPLTNGQQIAVDIDYTIDNPQPVLSESAGSVGWFATPGGSYVLNEPEGARHVAAVRRPPQRQGDVPIRVDRPHRCDRRCQRRDARSHIGHLHGHLDLARRPADGDVHDPTADR